MNKIHNNVIFLLFCLISFACAKAQAQACVAQIPEAVGLYRELVDMFPYSDYVKLDQAEACYWVNSSMKSDKTFDDGMKKICQVIPHLKAMCTESDVLIDNTHSTDSLVFACRPSFCDSVQINYLEIVYNRQKLHFYYGSHLNDKNSIGYEANDHIVGSMDSLMETYLSRPGVSADSIVYNGPAYQYQLVTFANQQQIMQHAEGVIYTIPDCSMGDWYKFYGKMKNYAMIRNVKVAWNDIYREYESVEIWIDRANTIPVVFAAAFKGKNLKILRLVGTPDYNIVLPRVWPEDSPVFSPRRIRKH